MASGWAGAEGRALCPCLRWSQNLHEFGTHTVFFGKVEDVVLPDPVGAERPRRSFGLTASEPPSPRQRNSDVGQFRVGHTLPMSGKA